MAVYVTAMAHRTRAAAGRPQCGCPKAVRYLKDDEAVRLFRALQASPNPLLPYIIAMLLLTGARKREVLTAKWSDIDLEQRRWRIEFNKTGNTRYVPLSEAMISLLAHLPRQDDNDYLFPSPKTEVPFISVFHSWDSARRKAGLADVRIHDLRHNSGSRIIPGAGLLVFRKRRVVLDVAEGAS